jgi:hypothetical protein
VSGQTQPPLSAVQHGDPALLRGGLGMLCDHTQCGQTITLGLAMTLEEAQAFSTGDAWPTPDAVIRGADGRNLLLHADLPLSLLTQALHAAAAVLGWRKDVDTGETFCPEHAQGLVCAGCESSACTCLGGPWSHLRFDTVRR